MTNEEVAIANQVFQSGINWMQRAAAAEAHAAELEGLLAQAKVALEFYAEESRYEVDEELRDHGTEIVAVLVDDELRHDLGQKARAALATLPTPQAGTEQHGSTP